MEKLYKEEQSKVFFKEAQNICCITPQHLVCAFESGGDERSEL